MKQKSLKKRRLFVRDIPDYWDTTRLIKEFSKLGPIQQAYIVNKSTQKSGNSKGSIPGTSKFGYVITASQELSEELADM